MEIYCLSCKKNTKSKNIRGKITKNNKPYLIGNCINCDKLKSKFLSIKEIKGVGFFLIYLKHPYLEYDILKKIYLIIQFHY